jgi:hypothetical protein
MYQDYSHFTEVELNVRISPKNGSQACLWPVKSLFHTILKNEKRGRFSVVPHNSCFLVSCGVVWMCHLVFVIFREKRTFNSASVINLIVWRSILEPRNTSTGIWYMICDTWYVIHDMWYYMIHDMWYNVILWYMWVGIRMNCRCS